MAPQTPEKFFVRFIFSDLPFSFFAIFQIYRGENLGPCRKIMGQIHIVFHFQGTLPWALGSLARAPSPRRENTAAAYAPIPIFSVLEVKRLGRF